MTCRKLCARLSESLHYFYYPQKNSSNRHERVTLPVAYSLARERSCARPSRLDPNRRNGPGCRSPPPLFRGEGGWSAGFGDCFGRPQVSPFLTGRRLNRDDFFKRRKGYVKMVYRFKIVFAIVFFSNVIFVFHCPPLPAEETGSCKTRG